MKSMRKWRWKHKLKQKTPKSDGKIGGLGMKYKLRKDNIPTNVNDIGWQVQELISLITKRVTKKNRENGFMRELSAMMIKSWTIAWEYEGILL